MKKCLKKGILMAGILLFVSGLLLGPFLLAGAGNIAKGETIETPVYSVRTVNAQKQTLYTFIDVNGDTMCTQKIDLYPVVRKVS